MKLKKTNAPSLENNSSNDINALFDKKCLFFQAIIQKTILHVQNNKILDIVLIREVNQCIEMLGALSKKIKDLMNSKNNITNENLIDTLQEINNNLSGIFKVYGTESLEDMLNVCIGVKNTISKNNTPFFDLIKSYFHPISYSILSNSKTSPEIKCYEISQESKSFHMKVYGIKIVIYDSSIKKSLCIIGYLDDIIIDFINSKYINSINEQLTTNIPSDESFNNDSFTHYISSLILKDYLLYDYKDLYLKYTGYISQINMCKQKDISQIVKDFIDDDLFNKRITLIQLLIKTDTYENQYLAYLLYDTLSNDNNGSIDTQEQTILFDSFPWSIKKCFRNAMKNTIQYTTELTHYDVNKIPLEQQICLMNVGNNVKEKAMARLKEIKGKSEDSGSKARQYLDGLLKIPFGIFKKEHILSIMSEIKNDFRKYLKENNKQEDIQDNYTSVEILNYINKNKLNIGNDKKELIVMAKKINKYIKEKSLALENKITYTKHTKMVLKENIQKFINQHSNIELNIFGSIQNKFDKIQHYINDVKSTLDTSVYGHNKAKNQIARVIGQWINGEQDGHCFGFEGPPGIGKTSICKNGLANCLKDDEGKSRPFSMIQMGGDCQGSTLVGHNYTYVGSSWGNIVQILIDKRCMNPIIFIDEVDKISKTEHGKELIGILTHLLDSTQNDSFQDKYFSGINLDLSKALFILSYNDADLIDRILLDRIHRIKFTSLSLEEKIVITNKYMLPEIYKKMGLENMIIFEDDIIKHIIEQYTAEAGVRKLKEIFFEIIGEVNLEILMNTFPDVNYPRKIKKEDITKYFKDKHEIKYKQILSTSQIGVVNGMYATSLGTGGTLPISAKYFPSETFLDLKLTGLQQEVMKESMHLAFTIAWNLTSKSKQNEIRKMYDGKNKHGINIHAGDLDVQKEGPSAGLAITCVLYSLLNDLPIKQEFGITGEILMTCEASAIGGLGHKIYGSMKSGVTSFIFPQENDKDYNEFIAKYKDTDVLEGNTFHPVNNIQEVLDLVIEKK